MRRLGPTRAATYNNISPLVAAVAGILLLDEPITLLLIIGGGLTLVGVLMVRAIPNATQPEIDEVPLEPTPIIVAASVGD
jgi:drug/metabolite transporter (DMT)-like permease